MSGVLFHAAMPVLAGGGFLALALASDKPGPALLGRKATPAERLGLRLAGWPLLVLALACGMVGWGQGVGWVTWFGWLMLAGAGLVFAIPSWDRARTSPDPQARPRKPAPPVPLIAPPQSRMARMALILPIVAVPAAFVLAAALWPVQPVLRADAIHAKAGPWEFTIAEDTPRAPKMVLGQFPMKGFQIRFCNTCDDEIRAAYLKVNKPRSLRGAGLAFDEERWNRFVEIQVPNSTQPDSEIWLTVEGKDGSLHYASWPIRQIAPTTAAWLTERRQKP